MDDTHRFQEAWFCHYHDEIHIGLEEDWNNDHRSDMEPLYTALDVERLRVKSETSHDEGPDPDVVDRALGRSGSEGYSVSSHCPEEHATS